MVLEIDIRLVSHTISWEQAGTFQYSPIVRLAMLSLYSPLTVLWEMFGLAVLASWSVLRKIPILRVGRFWSVALARFGECEVKCRYIFLSRVVVTTATNY